MTPQQFAAKMAAKVAQLQARNAPLEIAARTVHAMTVKRIFDDGLSGESYNKTTPIYASDASLPRRGPHIGKRGKAIKSSYYPSYYALKQGQGFNPNVVNLRLNNDLQMDFANSTANAGTGEAKAGDPIKVNNSYFKTSVRRAENIQKMRGLLKKYGPFTALLPKEREAFTKVMKFEMGRILKS